MNFDYEYYQDQPDQYRVVYSLGFYYVYEYSKDDRCYNYKAEIIAESKNEAVQVYETRFEDE